MIDEAADVPSPGTEAVASPASPQSARGVANIAPLALTSHHEILSHLAHDAPLDVILSLIAQKAVLLTEGASALIALMDTGSREELTFAAVAGAERTDLTGARVLASDSVVGHTARTGEPYLAFRPSTLHPSHLAEEEVSSAAVVPLFLGGAPAGALAALNRRDGQPFDGADLLALSALSAAASAALVAAQRREESQRQSRELSVLYDAVRSVAGNLSTQDLLHAVVRQAAAHIENAAVIVLLLNDERTHLYVAEEEGLSDTDRECTLPSDSGLGRAVLTASRPLFLAFRNGENDLPLDGLPDAYEPPFPRRGVRSGLATAIRSGETTHGIVLVLSGQPPGTFNLADANLLSALAAQAAVAAENAFLFEDATRRAEEANALYELSQAVTSTLDLQDVLKRVADAALSLLGVDKFALFLRDRSGGNRLQLVMQRGLAEGAAERLRPEVGRGIPGWVVEFETPTAVQDIAADHRNASAPLHPEGVVSLACMPLQAGPTAIGVLCAMSSRRRLFTIAEMELLYTIANQASVAIENARMYEDVRQKGREIRKYFHRVARALGSSQSPEAVPRLIANLTLEIMGADRCALYELRTPEEAAPPAPPRLELVARAGFRINDEPEGSGTGAPGAPTPPPRPIADTYPTGWVARRARALAIADLAEEDRFNPASLRPARGKAASYLAVPLRSGKEVVGVLELFSRTRRQWRGDEVRLLLTFASQATVALQNARLTAERREASRDTRLLRRLFTLALQYPQVSAAQVVQTVYDETGLDTAAFRVDASPENSTLLVGAPDRDSFSPTDPAAVVGRSQNQQVLILCYVATAVERSLPLPVSPEVLAAAADLIAREPDRVVSASQ